MKKTRDDSGAVRAYFLERLRLWGDEHGLERAHELTEQLLKYSEKITHPGLTFERIETQFPGKARARNITVTGFINLMFQKTTPEDVIKFLKE